MSKVVAISDIHGNLPALPSADVVVIAGDLCPLQNHDVTYQAWWLNSMFDKWVRGLDAKEVIVIAGNHDFIFQKAPHLLSSERSYTYLQDSGVVSAAGLRIWGTPWQPPFYDWAFNLEEAKLPERWKLIPENLDILITHGPPQGYGDWTYEYKENEQGRWCRTGNKLLCGSPSLTERIKEVQPHVCVYGHLHDGYGQYQLEKSMLFNASFVNEKYQPAHKPWEIEIFSLSEATKLLGEALRNKYGWSGKTWFAVGTDTIDTIHVYCDKKIDAPLEYFGWRVKMTTDAMLVIGEADE